MARRPASSRSPTTATSSGELLERARGGSERALSTLFRRQGSALRRWAHGRLPQWARSLTDTADLVQEALLQTFQRIDRFEDRGKGALQAYLRQAVMNRIRDEVRRVGRRPITESDDGVLELPSDESSPFDAAFDAEQERRHKKSLAALSEDERLLVVGRMELGYNYEQLALITRRSTAEAARLAVRRAVIKLAHSMTGV